MKKIPDSFYIPYFELARKESLEDPVFFERKMYELEILRKDDSPKDVAFFTALFNELLSVFTQPLQHEWFDFSNPKFMNEVAALSEKLANDKILRKMNGNRGSKHFIYVNRTFFGLYSLLSDLKANVKINDYEQYHAQGQQELSAV